MPFLNLFGSSTETVAFIVRVAGIAYLVWRNGHNQTDPLPNPPSPSRRCRASRLIAGKIWRQEYLGIGIVCGLPRRP